MGWARANLFGSWWSTAVTLLLGYLILRIAISFVSWAFLNAVWTVPYNAQGVANTAACQIAKGIGACWAIIADKYRLILFGRYPYQPAVAAGDLRRCCSSGSTSSRPCAGSGARSWH